MAKFRVLIALSRDYVALQSMLLGIRKFAQETTRTSFILRRFTRFQRSEGVFTEGFDGLLGWIAEENIIEFIQNSPIPAVSMNRPHSYVSVPFVAADHVQVGIKAAEHLLERGLHRFIYFFAGDQQYSHTRGDGFKQIIEPQGYPIHALTVGTRIEAKKRWSLEDQIADLADVLRDSPKPVGLFAVDEAHGERALEAAALAGLRVPDDVAIMCAGGDDLFCEFFEPQLSQVRIDNERIGYEAARLLEQILAGEVQPPYPNILIDCEMFKDPTSLWHHYST